MFKCNNINQSKVTMSLTEVQQSQSQLPKSTENRFGCLIRVVIIKKVSSEIKCTIRIMVKNVGLKGNSLTLWEIGPFALRAVMMFSSNSPPESK